MFEAFVAGETTITRPIPAIMSLAVGRSLHDNDGSDSTI